MSRSVDEPDDGGGFLGRWSKRKAQARVQPDTERSDAAESAMGKTGPEARDTLQGELKKEEEVFDLTKLPSLEEITGETNLSDFMRKEVPAALRNAALKKAWALDPVIRDYVNPAREYAYDWNTPGGVPGNGPIETAIETIREMVASAQSSPEDHTLGERDSTEASGHPAHGDPAAVAEEPSAVRLSGPAETADLTENKAYSPDDAAPPPAPRVVAAEEAQRPRRRHGGAAPA